MLHPWGMLGGQLSRELAEMSASPPSGRGEWLLGMLGKCGVVLGRVSVCQFLAKLAKLLFMSVVLSRLCLLFAHVWDFVSDLGLMGRDVVKLLWEHLLGFDEATWESLFHDSTSPIPAKRILDPALLEKGLGEIGAVAIPIELWNATRPGYFSWGCEDPIHTKPMSV